MNRIGLCVALLFCLCLVATGQSEPDTPRGLGARPPATREGQPILATPTPAVPVQTAVLGTSSPVPPAPTPAAAPKPTKPDYWQQAREEAYESVQTLLAQHRAERRRGGGLGIFAHGDPRKKQIALTFDDGPHPKATPQLLAILRQYHVKATFFVVGEMAEQYPDLIRAEAADGHVLANHTYHHVNLKKIPLGQVATELKACGKVLWDITGKPVHLFRPPGGQYNDDVARVAQAMGYATVLWTVNTSDYKNPGAGEIGSRVQRGIDNGGIVLMHDGVSQTMEVLPRLIEVLRGKGYEFVTIDQLMGR